MDMYEMMTFAENRAIRLAEERKEIRAKEEELERMLLGIPPARTNYNHAMQTMLYKSMAQSTFTGALYGIPIAESMKWDYSKLEDLLMASLVKQQQSIINQRSTYTMTKEGARIMREKRQKLEAMLLGRNQPNEKIIVAKVVQNPLPKSWVVVDETPDNYEDVRFYHRGGKIKRGKAKWERK